MRQDTRGIRLFILCLGFGLAASAQATTLTPVTARQLVAQAELIFQGVVSAVDYRMSVAQGADEVALPHTFVTFAIERIFKGNTEDPEFITLRFQGGRAEDGRILMVEGVPLFDVGDRDLLFVSRNGTHLCPLIGWRQGRFRLIDGAVYSDDGREVWLTPKRELAYGAAVPLDEVFTHHVGEITLRQSLPVPSRPREIPMAGEQLNAERLLAFITRLVGQLHRPDDLPNLAPVASARPDQEFRVRELRPVAPPPASTPATPSPKGTPEDAHEEHLFERNDGDPVLPLPRP